MASRLSTSMSLDPGLVQEIAVELAISPAFVEKDWYAVQALKAVAGYQSDAFQTIFSGGTSLSKAYGLIQRFSEDLDFRCLELRSETGNQMKKLRRVYRECVLDQIESSDVLTLDRGQVTSASNYVKFALGYEQSHGANPALRAGLQIEFSFTQPRLNPQVRSIQSFVSKFSGGRPELEMLCLSPVETAADKLSALTWRVLKRERGAENDDPAMVRHLHDLAALVAVIEKERGLFVETALASFEEDQSADKRNTEAGLSTSFADALTVLKNDSEYRVEYSQFVEAMSYAADDQRIDFDSALMTLDRLHTWLG